MKNAAILLTLALSSAFPYPLEAGDLSKAGDGMLVWRAGNIGPEIHRKMDGTISVFVRATEPVSGSDGFAISKGEVIAEEKAKAAILRWISEEGSTQTTIKSVERDVRDSSGMISSTDKQKVIEDISNTISFFSSGKLRGVVVIAQGFDAKSKIVWVDVGFTNRAISEAKEIGRLMGN